LKRFFGGRFFWRFLGRIFGAGLLGSIFCGRFLGLGCWGVFFVGDFFDQGALYGIG